MSTDVDAAGDAGAVAVDISRRLGSDGDYWIARDEDTSVTSQGTTRQGALENLDEAVAGFHGAGEPPSTEELREFGIDPANNTSGSISDSNQFE